MEDLIVSLRIEEDNRKSEKRSNKNSYEAKAKVIEDSKGKTPTSKGLKRKKTVQWYKGKVQEGKNMRFKETGYIRNKEGHKANECHSGLKKEQEEPSIGKPDRPCIAKPFSCGVRSKSDDQQRIGG